MSDCQRDSDGLIVIGASAGGMEAMARILAAFGGDCPPTVVVQHTPGGKIIDSYAARIDRYLQVDVRIASEGATLQRGQVALSPGGSHLEVRRRGRSYRCHIVDGPPVAFCKPSVDVLMASAAQAAGCNASAAILTGMGHDGAAGLLAMRRAGARTCVQDEATSAAYGMPQAAAKRGGAEVVLPLHRIASFLLGGLGQRATSYGGELARRRLPRLGEELVDRQHEALSRNLRRFHAKVRSGAGAEVVEPMLNFLERYARAHFAHEEELVPSLRSPAARENRTAHRLFERHVARLKDRLQDQDVEAVAREVDHYLIEWLYHHVCVVDAALADAARARPTRR